MPDLNSTPAFVSGVYAAMRSNLEIARSRTARPLTLADKILLSHLDRPEVQDMSVGLSYLRIRPDRVVMHESLGQMAMLQFIQIGKKRVALPATIHCDHLIEAHLDGMRDLPEAVEKNREIYDFFKSAAAKYGVGFWAPGGGIMHQVNLEKYAFPGALILGTDSHTPNAGGTGACGIGVGGTDVVEVMAGLPWEVLYPKRFGVQLSGEMSGWTAPKDVILKIAGMLGVSGGTNTIIEYFGPGAETISCTGKATITNMGAELGATTSVFAYDKKIATFLSATGRTALAELADANIDLLKADEEVLEHPHDYFDQVIELDLSSLAPQVVGPHSPDLARPLAELGDEVRENEDFIDEISVCLIGSCTNSSYEDMSRVADLVEQARSHGLVSRVSLLVTPGSEMIRATLERDGQLDSLRAIGATILANACGPCIGQWRRETNLAGKPNTIVTSYNRNFPARNDGQPETMNFIASPEVTLAFALSGRLSFNPLAETLTGSDGKAFTLGPPARAQEVPSQGYVTDESAYCAPPADGSSVELKISPDSERLQLLEPWPPWDGKDITDAPILIKAKGKTTTDAIAPAGPWLRFRGHLDKTSDGMLTGAINAYTGEAGTGLNLVTGDRGLQCSAIARDYKARKIKWIVVGDWNYGEGSSREHAALCPRLLGAAAVIARSFARIHETNLKKQGLLALTFTDPDDYEVIREDDRLDLVNLGGFRFGEPMDCIVRHGDGTHTVIKLEHTFSEAQISWFKAGSALNLLA